MHEDEEKHNRYEWKLVDRRTGKVVLEGKSAMVARTYEREDTSLPPINQSGYQAEYELVEENEEEEE